MPTSIATWYNSRFFRSKLEANWAEYFDFCEIDWAYESEGYELSNGARYLPDFYLPKLDVFVECRGALDRSLRKPAMFLKETNKPLLLAFPEGRFFFATTQDDETGSHSAEFVEALFTGDQLAFERFQKTLSCLIFLDDDAEGPHRVYFANYGYSSPDYCGSAPDWSECIKDRSRKGAPSMDARAFYYGGHSTWQGRGFQPARIVVGAS